MREHWLFSSFWALQLYQPAIGLYTRARSDIHGQQPQLVMFGTRELGHNLVDLLWDGRSDALDSRDGLAMKYIIYGVIGLGVLGFLFMDQGESKPKINLTEVLNRSVVAMDRFDKYLKQNNVEKATDQHLEQMNTFLQKVMNTEPRLQEGLIATRLGKDAKFTGVDDANGNSVADAEEKQLFTLELDSANQRMIATDASGNGTQRGFSGMGFIAGALIGSMLGRQRAAGITPGSFSNRKVASPSAYNKARSRARSGGLRGGK